MFPPEFRGCNGRNEGNDGRELQAELVERAVITRGREDGVDSKSPRPGIRGAYFETRVTDPDERDTPQPTL